MAPDTSMLHENFGQFKHQASAARICTRLSVLESLRDNHPDHHITVVEKSRYDFLGFASQGHAEAKLQPSLEGVDRELFDATRDYMKPSRLVENAVGGLNDTVFFGCFQYTWNGQEHVLYKGVWKSTCVGHVESYYYVLSRRSEGVISDGHSSYTDALLLVVGKWTSIAHDEIYVFDQSHWQKSAKLWQSIKGSSWDDVILEPNMKQSLIEDVQGFYDSRQLYSSFSVPWKRGIILHGVPGNGKTVSIKALINYLTELPNPVPSLYVKSFDNKCNGEQASIRSIFDHARKMAPCLLVFEDLDSLVTKDVRSYFLNEVDGLESNDGILMIGSTNHLNSLDPAISKRPSRFDRKYHFKVPSHAERVSYCKYWQGKLSGNESVDLSTDICEIVATLTDGFSFAYLKELFVMTLLTVARGGKGLDEATENGWDVVSNSNSPAEAAADSSSPANGKTDDVDKPTTPKQNKERPVVEVPEHLRENILLRVIQQQVRVLLHEMDNTEEEETVLPLLSGDGARIRTPAVEQFATLAVL